MDYRISELRTRINELNHEINERKVERNNLQTVITEMRLESFKKLIGTCFTNDKKCFMITDIPEASFTRICGKSYNLNQIPAYVLYIDKNDEDYGCLDIDTVCCRYTNEDGNIFELIGREFKQITVEEFYNTIKKVSIDFIKKVGEKNG